MRGGWRPNSGRKPKLTDWDRIEIGIKCEAIFTKAADTLQQAKIQKQHREDSDYTEVIGKLKNIPVGERSAWLQSSEYIAHCADVEQERHAIAGTDADDGNPAPRMMKIPRVRPYGVRKSIIEAVASEWLEQTGISISASTVTRCWEEWRAILSDEDSQEKG